MEEIKPVRKIVVFGATSSIAQEMIRIFAKRGDKLFLVGRDQARLQIVAEDARALGAGAEVMSQTADLEKIEGHADLLYSANNFLQDANTVILAHGVLGDQKKGETDFREVERVFSTNTMSSLSLLTLVATQFEKSGRGEIVFLSSPAAERGRRSNYIYGASKAAVSTFLSGLRNRLFSSGVHVMTVYPGFVDTPMTRDFKKGPLWSEPDVVAEKIVAALDRKCLVVYTPWYWRFIMFIIRHIPESIFVKLNI
jgi:decaprenylphospho-beta-D-erythro-pentofuranosid-2-ulose 2-reductase